MAVEIASAYISLVPSAQNIGTKLYNELRAPAEAAGKDAGEKASKGAQVALGAGAVAAGQVLANGVMFAFNKVFDLAKALPDLGAQFQKATAGIRIGTGATGAQLADLTQSFENVYQRTPAGMGDVSDAITVLTQRVDNLTGKPLEDLALGFIRLSRLTGTDLKGNLKGITAAFRQFGIPADQMGGKLDELLRLYQQTGVGVDELVGQLNSSGVSLRALGLNFEDSASLIALLGEAGLDASQFTAKFTRALAEAAKEGKPAKQVFQETFASIKNAPNDIIATQRAMDLFGPKGAAMAQAIREGRLSFEDLSRAIKDGDTLGQAAADTSTWAGKLEVLKHKLEIDLKPVADGVFSGMTGALDWVGKWFDEHKPQIEQGLKDLKGTWEALKHDFVDDPNGARQSKGGDLVDQNQGAGPAIREFFLGPPGPNGQNQNPADAFLNGADRVKQALSGMQASAQASGDDMAAGWATLQEKWHLFTGDLSAGAGQVGATLSPVWDGIQQGAKITGFIIQGVGNTVVSVGNMMWQGIQGTWNGITEIAGSVWNTLTTLFQDGTRTITGLWNAFTSALRGDWEGMWDGIKQWMQGTVDSILHTIGGVADAIRAVVVAVWDVAKGIVNGFIAAWNSFQIPALNIDLPFGKSINWGPWDTPDLPLLAKGGVITTPTAAILGETAKARPEIVTPEALMREVFASEMARAGGHQGSITNIFQTRELSAAELAADVDYRVGRQLGGRQR